MNLTETNRNLTKMVNFEDLVCDVIKIIVSCLKYEDIVSLCNSGILHKDLYNDRSFWIYYLTRTYNLDRIDYGEDLNYIRKGIQIAEKSRVNYICNIHNHKYHPFILKIYINDNEYLDLSNMINLTRLNFGRNNHLLDLSNMVNLVHLHLGRNDKCLDLNNMPNLTFLQLGHSGKYLDLSKLINLTRLNFGYVWRLLDLSKLINLTHLNIRCNNRPLDLSKLVNLITIRKEFCVYDIRDNPNNLVLPKHLLY